MTETEELIQKVEQATKRLRNATLDFKYSQKILRFSERVEFLLATYAVKAAVDQLKKHLERM